MLDSGLNEPCVLTNTDIYPPEETSAEDGGAEAKSNSREDEGQLGTPPVLLSAAFCVF